MVVEKDTQATLAQLVEHRSCKAGVEGSSPLGGSLNILNKRRNEMTTTTKLTTGQLTEKVATLEVKIGSLERRISKIKDEIFSISQNTPRVATKIATNIINEIIANERSKQPISPSNN
jgi:hypothetical protein